MALWGRQGKDEADDVTFRRLLAAARAGSGDALGDLLQGCRRYLLRAANQTLESTLRPKEGASDLVQRTFVVAHRDFQAFRGESPGELLAWLNRILERQFANHVRYYRLTSKRTVRREIALDAIVVPNDLLLADDRATSLDIVALADEKRRITIAMERLSNDHQLILQLRTWQRLPFSEVGLQMSRSSDAAQKLWMRAVERLQIELSTVE